MDMSFGKYEGKPVAAVFLNFPEYFEWMNGEKNMHNKKEYKFMLKLKQTLDSKPFSGVKCSGYSCEKVNTPTRLSLYNGQYWFCDSCDLYEQGAQPGKLGSIRTYDQFVRGKNNELSKVYYKAKEVPVKTKANLKKYFGY